MNNLDKKYVCDRIEYDVWDLLMVDKDFTDGKEIGLGINKDENLLCLVNLETSEILDSREVQEDKLVGDIEDILNENFGNSNVSEDMLADFLASYVVSLVEV